MPRAEPGGKLPNIVLVIGTRPEAIKLAPVAEALSTRGIAPTLIFPGQHPALGPADHGLDYYDSVRLRCPGRANPHAHVGAVTRAVLPLLGEADLVIVQGDTSSALGGALAADAAGVPLAHVEAGLRSHDRRRPWPEEEFRVAIDARAHLLFAPTELSAANLRRERVTGTILVTGNTAVDAVVRIRRSLKPLPRRDHSPPRLLVTCHRRESWGDGLASIAAALRALAQGCDLTIDLVLHSNPTVADQMRAELSSEEWIRLRQPCGHSEMIALMLGSTLILSDSGGMQEEAAALGIPLLVLRERSERPEAIACGAIQLAGTGADSIVAAVRRLIASPDRLSRMRAARVPYGDGRASERIAAVVVEWLAGRTSIGSETLPVELPIMFQSA